MFTSLYLPQSVSLITYFPEGIGKTTLVKAVCQKLQEEKIFNLCLSGFFTEEVRESGRSGRGHRIGFDVVTLTGERGPLARIERQDYITMN